MIAASILRGRCRHVRRVMMMVMAMRQIGHFAANFSQPGMELSRKEALSIKSRLIVTATGAKGATVLTIVSEKP
jgi:hypothetical protein